MKRFPLILISLLPSLGWGEGHRHELLVHFRADTTAFTRHQLIADRNHRIVRELGSRGLVQVQVPAVQRLEDARRDYAADPAVDSVQPNFLYHSTAFPNDPNYSEQWGLKNTGQTITTSGGIEPIDTTANPGVAGRDMGMEAAWNIATDCSSVVVAVIDTGVNYDHVDLVGNFWDGGPAYPHHGYDFVDNTDDPRDLMGHGTHVAGTIAAVGNNGVGGTGICWKAQLMALRALDAAGVGTSASIIAAIDFAVGHGARVINMSFGQYAFDAAVDSAIADASAAGVIVVAAAGNDHVNNDTSPSYPCSEPYPNVVCVAALDQAYGLAYFSNYGSRSVAIGAPGTNIFSTWSGTTTTSTDPMSSGWTLAGGPGSFGYVTGAVGGKMQSLLVDPPTYDQSTQKYAENTDDEAYKSFDLSGYDAAFVSFGLFYDMSGSDTIRFAMSPGGGSPQGGTTLENCMGSTNLKSVALSYDLSSCLTSTCSLGFELKSGASQNFGMAAYDLQLIKLKINSTSYQIIEGTSMATPHVTGLLALILAANPSYTSQDAIAALENGATSLPSLASQIAQGRAASASGSLTYIAPPTGVTVTR